MKEKKQKQTEKKEINDPTNHKCLDCNTYTDNFYCIPTNRGNIFKCNTCYEHWCVRETRGSYLSGRQNDLDSVKGGGQKGVADKHIDGARRWQ